MWGEYRSPVARARLAKVAILLAFVLSAIAIGSDLVERDLLTQLENETEVSAQEAESSDSRQSIIGYTCFPVFIFMLVAVLLWVNRAYKNLPHLKGPEPALRYTPGWAVGYFFVPVLHLYHPLRILQEVWRYSNRPVLEKNSWFVNAWWMFWLGNALLSKVSYRVAAKAESISELQRSNLLDLSVLILGLISMVFTWLLIDKATRLQDEMWALRRLGAATTPAPAAARPGGLEPSTSA